MNKNVQITSAGSDRGREKASPILIATIHPVKESRFQGRHTRVEADTDSVTCRELHCLLVDTRGRRAVEVKGTSDDINQSAHVSR